VAVKTLHTERAGDPGFQTRFRHEARTMAALHHPGVADVYDYGQTADGDEAYIVMARVQGEALNQVLAARGRLSPVETMSVVAQAARALEAAHQAGIVHRDVKPGNLIIQPDGTVVLVDFGVARSAESAALTGAKEVVGTALYIAPEQVSKQTTGPAADVYALGAVAFHCLAGHPPFQGDNPIAVAMQHVHDDPPDLPADVPEPVRMLVRTAMAKDPARRFSSAAAMAGAAEAAQRILPGGTTAIGDETAVLAPLARGSATVRPPVSHTAVMPAVLPEAQAGPPPTAGLLPDAPGAGPGGPPPARGRRRTVLAVTAALLAAAAIAAVLALVNPGGILPDSPGTSTTPSVAPSTKAGAGDGSSAGTGNGGNGAPSTRPRKSTTAPAAPATGATSRGSTASPSVTPSRTPTTTATTGTTEPERTATGGAPPTATTGAADQPGDPEAGGTPGT
jgi:predicted Ser/Thr protein kinase